MNALNKRNSIMMTGVLALMAIANWNCSPVGRSYNKDDIGFYGRFGTNNKGLTSKTTVNVVKQRVVVVGNDVIEESHTKKTTFQKLSSKQVQDIKTMSKTEIEIPKTMTSQAGKNKSKVSLILVLDKTGKELDSQKLTLKNLSIEWQDKTFTLQTPSSAASTVVANLLKAGYLTADKSSVWLDRKLKHNYTQDNPNLFALRLKSKTRNEIATVGWLLNL